MFVGVSESAKPGVCLVRLGPLLSLLIGLLYLLILIVTCETDFFRFRHVVASRALDCI